MKVAFAGTPEFAATALRAILAAGFEVPLVLSQPDRPAGRGHKLQPSSVKAVAQAHGIAVDQPEKLRTPEQQAALRAAQADVLVVAAYGLILPQSVLDLPRAGCINIHASLLPRWRGAAPIHRALEAGDSQSGITIMQMDAGLDTGPMLLRRALPITADDTGGSLHDRLAALGAVMIVEALHAIAAGSISPTTQPTEGTSYAAKILKAESALDFRQPAATLERKIRAFDPSPGCSATLAGNAVKIWQTECVSAQGEPGRVLTVDDEGILVACGEGALRLIVLQKAGGRRLTAANFLRGNPLAAHAAFDLPTSP